MRDTLMIGSHVGLFYHLYQATEISFKFYIIYINKLRQIHYFLRFFHNTSYQKYHTKTVSYLEVSSILTNI
jgi:hypothetical protein